MKIAIVVVARKLLTAPGSRSPNLSRIASIDHHGSQQPVEPVSSQETATTLEYGHTFRFGRLWNQCHDVGQSESESKAERTFLTSLDTDRSH